MVTFRTSFTFLTNKLSQLVVIESKTIQETKKTKYIGQFCSSVSKNDTTSKTTMSKKLNIKLFTNKYFSIHTLRALNVNYQNDRNNRLGT